MPFPTTFNVSSDGNDLAASHRCAMSDHTQFMLSCLREFSRERLLGRDTLLLLDKSRNVRWQSSPNSSGAEARQLEDRSR